MTRRIYLAGKISKSDWRAALLNVRDASMPPEGDFYSSTYPSVFKLTEMYNGHLCTGPYFVSCDHGCYHGDNEHGVGAASGGCYSPHEPGQATGETRRHVVAACAASILVFSDTVFAWIDSTDCYGTIAEIGIAAGRPGEEHGWNKVDIWIAGPEYLDDLWFVYQLANDTTFNYNNPKDAIEYFLKKHDGVVSYRDYIQSQEWRTKATTAKERAGNRCQVCNKPSTEVTLDAHHRTYERLGHERSDDITVLCRDCHELYEKNKKARRNGGNR